MNSLTPIPVRLTPAVPSHPKIERFLENVLAWGGLSLIFLGAFLLCCLDPALVLLLICGGVIYGIVNSNARY